VAHELTLVAVAALRDPARPEAPAAVRDAHAAGIRVVMVTGDHPGTALAIAQEVGIAGEVDSAVTGAALRAMAAPSLAAPVFARVDPQDKLALVEAFQSQGHVVAVTGDGVNDVPALHRADVGVAMGASGTQAAREASSSTPSPCGGRPMRGVRVTQGMPGFARSSRTPGFSPGCWPGFSCRWGSPYGHPPGPCSVRPGSRPRNGVS
jgi:soluble P-type ATPase